MLETTNHVLHDQALLIKNIPKVIILQLFTLKDYYKKCLVMHFYEFECFDDV